MRTPFMMVVKPSLPFLIAIALTTAVISSVIMPNVSLSVKLIGSAFTVGSLMVMSWLYEKYGTKDAELLELPDKTKVERR
jgi:hypothetical protein